MTYNNSVLIYSTLSEFYSDTDLKISETQKLYTSGWEALKFREYKKASDNLLALIKIDPSHQEGLVKLAELEYRKTNFDKALEYFNKSPVS